MWGGALALMSLLVAHSVWSHGEVGAGGVLSWECLSAHTVPASHCWLNYSQHRWSGILLCIIPQLKQEGNFQFKTIQNNFWPARPQMHSFVNAFPLLFCLLIFCTFRLIISNEVDPSTAVNIWTLHDITTICCASELHVNIGQIELKQWCTNKQAKLRSVWC